MNTVSYTFSVGRIGVPVLPGGIGQLSPTSPKSPSDIKLFPGDKGTPHDDSHDKKKTPKRGHSQREKAQDTPKRGESPARDVKFGGTTEWQYPSDLVIVDIRELAALDEFILKKVYISFIPFHNTLPPPPHKKKTNKKTKLADQMSVILIFHQSNCHSTFHQSISLYICQSL